ncbi:MAG TPA: GNVR domain-containing protein, partial [Terriglobales bacterium]|nr:GNVR domain-containing protein [Terriglobales bacterium]
MTRISTAPDLEIAGPIPSRQTASAVSRAELVLAKTRLLWRSRRFLYRVTALGLLLGVALAFLIPRRFESTTRLMPPDSQSTASVAMLAALSTKVGSGLGSVAGDMLGLKSSGDLFIGILQSRTVQDRLIERFDLRRVYGTTLWQDARKKLNDNTGISQDRKSGIITITVLDRDPHRAAAMGQAYVEELNRLVSELSTSGAHRQRVFLEERLKTVQQDLEAAEKDFSEFASKNMAIDIKEQGKAMVEAAATLQGQLIAAESEMEGLRQIYTPNNVRVRSVQARIASLKQQMENIGGKGEPSDSLYPSIRKLPVLGVTYADMYRRTKVEEAVFEALTQQYELAKVEEVRETPSVRVLDQANLPEKKSFPPRMLIVTLATIFSSLLGAAWVLGGAHWQEMAPEHPAKVVLLGVYGGARAHLEHASRNGGG